MGQATRDIHTAIKRTGISLLSVVTRDGLTWRFSPESTTRVGSPCRRPCPGRRERAPGLPELPAWRGPVGLRTRPPSKPDIIRPCVLAEGASGNPPRRQNADHPAGRETL